MPAEFLNARLFSMKIGKFLSQNPYVTGYCISNDPFPYRGVQLNERFMTGYGAINIGFIYQGTYTRQSSSARPA